MGEKEKMGRKAQEEGKNQRDSIRAVVFTSNFPKGVYPVSPNLTGPHRGMKDPRKRLTQYFWYHTGWLTGKCRFLS